MLKSLSSAFFLLMMGAGSAVLAQEIGSAALGGGSTDDPIVHPRKERPLPKGPVVVDRIAATVNGRVVTSNELSFMLLPMAQQLAALYPQQGEEFHKQLSRAKDQILDDLINRELLLGEFEERGFQYPDSIVDQEVERTIREKFAGNRDEFLRNLAATSMTIRQFRDITKRQMIVMSLRAQKYDMEVPPTPDEIRKEYNRSKSQYRDMSKDKISFNKIFIPVGPSGSEEGNPAVQKNLADMIAAQIKKGEATFEDMAKNYSKDMYAAEGGKCPEFTRADIAAEFGAILFDAPEKTIIGPLIAPNGFSIVRINKKELAPAPPLEKVKTLVDDQVRRVKSAARYERWISRLRESAIIKKYI